MKTYYEFVPSKSDGFYVDKHIIPDPRTETGRVSKRLRFGKKGLLYRPVAHGDLINFIPVIASIGVGDSTPNLLPCGESIHFSQVLIGLGEHELGRGAVKQPETAAEAVALLEPITYSQAVVDLLKIELKELEAEAAHEDDSMDGPM